MDRNLLYRRDSLGGVRTIAIEPTNSRTIYAGAPKGGVRVFITALLSLKGFRYDRF